MIQFKSTPVIITTQGWDNAVALGFAPDDMSKEDKNRKN